MASLAIPLLAMGENFFQEGTTWHVRCTGTHHPDPVYTDIEFRAEGDTTINGSTALKISSTIIGNGAPATPSIYVKSENGRILFWDNNTRDWYLMYDFNLKKGDGCTIYSIPLNDHIKSPEPTYVKCTHTDLNQYYDNIPQIALQEYTDSSCSTYIGDGEWLVGIGSTKGVIENNRFEILDGGTSYLTHVSSFDNIVCRYAPSGVKTPDQQTVQICINGKTLHIPECSDNRISVFTPEGILLKDTDISCGGCQISLPSSGIYIISNGSYRIKIKL